MPQSDASQTAEPFLAHASRLQALVAISAFLPLTVIGFLALPLAPDAPLWARIMGLVIVAPIVVFLATRLKLLIVTAPTLEISPAGLLWRGWSETLIPWSAVARWRTKTYFGHQQATFWLHEPSLYPSSTVNGLINPGNKWLGFGDITLNAGGTNRDFAELAAALTQFAPLPPLPDDPRHRRKILQARQRSAR